MNASLFDVFDALNIDTTLGVWQNDGTVSEAVSPLAKQHSGSQSTGITMTFNWRPDPFVFYSVGPASVTIGPLLTFDAAFDFTLSTYKQSIREMSIRWRGNLLTQLSADVALAATADVQFKKAIYSQTLPRRAFMIGFVPFWIQPIMNIDAGIRLHADDSMKFQSSVGLQSSVAMQARWTLAGGIQTVTSYTSAPIAKAPTFSAGCAATADVYIVPSFDIVLDDLVTMAAEMGPHLQFNYNAPPPFEAAGKCSCSDNATRNGYAATSFGVTGDVKWTIRGYSGANLRAVLFDDHVDLAYQCKAAPSACQAATCNKCSAHCLQQACFPADECVYGCVKGWYGRSCEMPCPIRCKQSLLTCDCRFCEGDFWGPDCETPCSSHCRRTPINVTACYSPTGECALGCMAGFWGHTCENTCAPRHCDDTSCYRTSGSCTACQPGWCGYDCLTPC